MSVAEARELVDALHLIALEVFCSGLIVALSLTTVALAIHALRREIAADTVRSSAVEPRGFVGPQPNLRTAYRGDIFDPRPPGGRL